MRWLGVDRGGTASRRAICGDDGGLLARGGTPAAAGLAFDASRAAFDAALRPIRAALEAGTPGIRLHFPNPDAALSAAGLARQEAR